MLFTTDGSDFLTLQEKTEEALYSIAHGMNLHLLDTPVRERMLDALDTLSLVWERLRQIPANDTLSNHDLHLLNTVCEICTLTRHATAEEIQRLSEVITRLARGLTEWLTPEVATAVQQHTATDAEQSAPPVAVAEPEVAQQVTPASVEPETVEPVQAEAPPEEPATAVEAPAETLSEEAATVEASTEPAPQEQPPAPAPQEQPTPVQPEREPYAGLAEKLDELSAVLDDVANHSMRRERAIARLMYAACLYRFLRPRATGWYREWELEQTRRQIDQLSDEKRIGVWLPPFDPKIEFSEHELQTLEMGYGALSKSWEMWEWYKQHGQVLDKGAGAPLLESIAAPIPMIYQIYNARNIAQRAMDVDRSQHLYDEIAEEAKARKWSLNMLNLTCARQKQVHYLNTADEHWQTAQEQARKKRAQDKALSNLERILANPDPARFEESLLCALIECHRAQVPHSNLRLRQIMQGYDWLLENPAVPDCCQLSPSESKSARSFLVNLGKYLIKDLQKGTQEEPTEEEEPTAEHNGDLLKQARRLTKGKKLFLLCFNRRAEAEQRIKHALQFSEVDWPDLDGSESLNDMEAHIRNADMTIVVVRYSRTHWKDADKLAKQHGKLFVMAPKGYGVTHLAEQIVKQCQAGG